MTIPRFFSRVHAAVGRHLAVDSATLEKRLDAVVVGLECGPSSDQTAAWVSELLINQLARLYPRLCIYGDDAMATVLRQLATQINPAVELVEDPARATTVVSAASTPPQGGLQAGASGWSAFVGCAIPTASRAGPPNPFGAGAAAALAASAIFRRVLLADNTAWAPVHLNLLAFEAPSGPSDDDLRPLEVGRLLIAGVGAVGNAALWVLGRHPGLSGRAIIVDPEDVELSNLQRYVLTDDTDVGRAKIDLGARALAGTALTIEQIKGRLGEVHIPEDVQNTLVTVDNVAGRRTAQALLPRLVVSGWTSDSGLGASWHDFRADAACLSCIYQPSGPAPSQTEIVARELGLAPERAAVLWITGEGVNARDVETMAKHLRADRAELTPWIGKPLRQAYTKLVCGATAISIGEDGRVEAVPLVHQSVLAGVLAAAELVKRLDLTLLGRLPPHNLIAWHDVTRAPPKVWMQRRATVAGCICSDMDYREAFRDKWRPHSA